MKIGIIGTGNIATFLLEQLQGDSASTSEVTALLGRNIEVGKRLASRYDVKFHTDITAFLKNPLDMVVEAATIEAAALYMKDVLASKKSMMVSSVGVFQDIQLLHDMTALATLHGVQIVLPSGAIGGLDLLKSANAVNGLKNVQITTRKSPASLGLPDEQEEELLFEGSAMQAIQKFPRNMNVALLLALAGIGAEQTKVRVIADPATKRNTHTIEADGDFGEMTLQITNNPMPRNPKTSYLAALSILEALRNDASGLRIGN